LIDPASHYADTPLLIKELYLPYKRYYLAFVPELCIDLNNAISQLDKIRNENNDKYEREEIDEEEFCNVFEELTSKKKLIKNQQSIFNFYNLAHSEYNLVWLKLRVTECESLLRSIKTVCKNHGKVIQFFRTLKS